MHFWIELVVSRPFLLLYAIVVTLSLVKYKKYFDTPLGFLPVLLMYTLLTEILGWITLTNPDWSLLLREYYYNNNWIIYNIYAIIFFLYFGYVYHQYLRSRLQRKLVLAGLSAYVAAVIINLFFEDFTTQTQLYSYAVGGALMVMAAGCYLHQELQNPETQGTRRRNLLLWLSAGIAVFYAGYVPIKFIRAFIASIQAVQSEWIKGMHLGLIYFMYGCFLVGLMLMGRMKKPQMKSTV